MRFKIIQLVVLFRFRMEALHPMTVKIHWLRKLERNDKNNQTKFWELSWQSAFLFDKKKKKRGGGDNKKQKATSNNSYGIWNVTGILTCCLLLASRHMAVAWKHFQALQNKHQCNPQKQKESAGNIIKYTNTDALCCNHSNLDLQEKVNFQNYEAIICTHEWHEGIRRWSIDPLILDVSTRWRQWTSCLSCLISLPLPSNSPSTHWQKTGWVPLLLLELWRREKYFSPATNRTTFLSFSVQNVVAIMTMLSWFCKNKMFKISYFHSYISSKYQRF